ncbi:probable prefoldin subunit 5 [Olea europaea subsp. europaea]|uniref:Probable prefoldin subunit 5 n=1 Tax=Olea europaea subsp. europaea TaxID=158383 RepID=A0A8S0SDI9_OLEEU|nr:probable prefoldin subunit 5 [Olea europaea subsp. europaea]
MASRGAGVGLEMEKMSLEQLRALKEQADLEFNLFQDSLNNIRTATARLEIASTALHDLSLRPQGKKMLVPLTASLYVPGSLDDADKVLVDVGTGYFIELVTKALKLGFFKILHEPALRGQNLLRLENYSGLN